MDSGEVSSKGNILNNEGNSVLAPIKQLEKYTDLNRPPSNWLKDNLAGKFAALHVKKRNAIDRSSLLMAHQYPGVVGEVDVISSADHIKKLLKIPFSTKELSLTVNRVGKSLLLNEIDIPALLKSYRNRNGEDLQWLHKLYCSAVNAPENSQFYPKKRNKEQCDLQKILSKFMHYSIEDSKQTTEESALGPDCVNENFGTPALESFENHKRRRKLSRTRSLTLVETSDLIDDYSVDKIVRSDTTLSTKQYPRRGSLPDEGAQRPVLSMPYLGASEFEGNDSGFEREILWTFEDIRMLVGSDLPIFGGGKYPTVSLRLRDSTKPINILTGIDYWLDNLMCSVPEIMMCYHSKGIVQKYEQIKTTDLPNLEGSSFSPKIIKDVAQNILSFLKANCTKEGHTYWLFKSNKDDVLKLYDLTSICGQDTQDNNYNPFTVSVGRLLYSIARNMYNSNEINKSNSHRIISLLQHCISLFEKEHQQYHSFKAYFLLLELLTVKLKDAEDEEFTDCSMESESDEEWSDAETTTHTDSSPVETVLVKRLCLPEGCANNNSMSLSNASIKIDEENRNKAIITHAISALKLLSTVTVKDNLPMLQALPGNMNENLVILNEQSVCVTKNDGNQHSIGNNLNTANFLKVKLYQKLVRAYLNLVSLNISKDKFGRSLRFLKIVSLCLSYLAINYFEDAYSRSKTHMFFADILTMATKKTLNMEAEILHFSAYNKNDSDLMTILGEIRNADLPFLDNIENIFSKPNEELLKIASDLYEGALGKITQDDKTNESAEQVVDIARRLGNIRNELGVFYMNKAASMTKGYGMPSEQEMSIWKTGFTYFEQAIEAFEMVQDWGNMALLYSNTARLMRLCAQVYGNCSKTTVDDSRDEFTEQEKICFYKAFEFYQKGLKLLEVRDVDTGIKVNICFEMSGAYLQMATLMQDYAPLKMMAEEKAVKEISHLLMKSLHYSEVIVEDSSQKQKEILSLRTGMVHKRLASLYHHVLRNQISDNGKRNYRSLSELHYKKVYDILQPSIHPVEFLNYIVEHIGLYDYLLKQSFSGRTLKSKLSILLSPTTNQNKLILSLETVLSSINDNVSPSEKYTEDINLLKITELLEKQVLSTFKEVLKFVTNKKNKAFDLLDQTKTKKILELLLRGIVPTVKNIKQRIATLTGIMVNMQDIYYGNGN